MTLPSTSKNGREGQFDIELFKQIQEHSTHLESSMGARNNIMRKMKDMYLLLWDEERAVRRKLGEGAKLTASPSARNALLGAIRLMIATDPIIKVPFEKNNPRARKASEKIERFTNKMWHISGRLTGDPTHYDVVRSALIFGEVCITVDSTKELLANASGAGLGIEKRLEAIHERTPYIFDVQNPTLGYPEFGRFGLDAYYTKRKVIYREVKQDFGQMAIDAVNAAPAANITEFSEVTLHDWYDLTRRVVWIENVPRPILMWDHELTSIPIVCQITEGTQLFDKPEEQREPFLYTLWKSGLWQRQNLALSVMYTMIFGIGSNPLFAEFLRDPSNPPVMDASKPGGRIRYHISERVEPFIKNAVDPSLLQGWEIADGLASESTIYPQALGEPLGANAPYSMVALLSQTGRLPLNTPQRKAGWAIGEAIEKSLLWMKAEGDTGRANAEGATAELAPKDIPDRFEVEAILDIKLPQDKLTMANIAVQLTQGDNPLVSERWARENILNVGQSDDMTEEIWEEKVAGLQYRKYVMSLMAELAQLEQAALQPQQASGIPGSQGLPPTGTIPPAQPGQPAQIGPPETQPVPPAPPPLEPFVAPGSNLPGGPGGLY